MESEIIEGKVSKEEVDVRGSYVWFSKPTWRLLGITDYKKPYHAEGWELHWQSSAESKIGEQDHFILQLCETVCKPGLVEILV